ncbi:hypothetical protein PR048_011062 [Dryococelus australis]|uniref:Uncharacterized protein n=1 Tax=Dryococelus australis TaxID=614101 RepID=A0ABQ9HKI1_9NEOP|nr:hypothetical protein PR048_011062 [Dryococelus australis]
MEMGTQINKPRTTNLQKNRSNFNSQTVEEYYRTSLYLPFMDIIIISIIRASKSWTDSKALSPEFSDGFEDEVLQGAEPYNDDLPYGYQTLHKSFQNLLQKAINSIVHYQILEFCFNSYVSYQLQRT